jgi:hypothetical protein
LVRLVTLPWTRWPTWYFSTAWAPGVGGERLHREVDAVALGVHVDDLDLHRLADLHDLARVVEAAEGELGAVDEAVHATEVHEHAEVGDLDDVASSTAPARGARSSRPWP